MTNCSFQEILDKLDRGEIPQFSKTVDGQQYTRVFLSENRLILLGGGHIAQPLCAMAPMLRFLAESTQPKACALVLSTTGSTPVKSGAMMAIDYLGNGYGTIGAAVAKQPLWSGPGKSWEPDTLVSLRSTCPMR